MKKDLKKIVINGIFILIGLFIIDIVIGKFGEIFIEKLPNYGGQLTKVNYITNRLKKDVIIVGSSRASHHYIPEMIKSNIDSLLHVDYSIYNAGVNGHPLDYNCCWIECILSRYLPKIIILDAADASLQDEVLSKELYDLNPYYGNNKIVTKYIDKIGVKEQIKLQLNQYKFNEKFIRYINGFISNNAENDGYEPLFGVMMKKQLKNKVSEEKQGNDKICYTTDSNFRNVLKLCNQKSITLVVVSSPRFRYNESNSIIAKICSEYNVPYIDMMKVSYFDEHPELFQDEDHLNDSGAKEFTALFLKQLKPYLNKITYVN